MQALLHTIQTLALPTQAQRLFHGRGGLHPGCEHCLLDAYPPAWLLTSFLPATDDELATVHTALQQRWQQLAPGQPLVWVFQCRHGGQAQTRLMAGHLPDPLVVTEAGARFVVNLLRGQNHGLFLDMAQGRRWVHDHNRARPGQKLLNLFAYTCAFSVVALQGGARQVVNLDMSRSALATGQHNHRLNGLSGLSGPSAGASFLPHDLFSSWGKLVRGGPYDLVIADPPSHQKGSFVAQKDYPRLVRRLPELLAPGGHALLCLNAPELGPDFVQAVVQAEAPALHCVQRLANAPVFADVDENRSLKVLVYAAPA